jgi:hypothetical protein
MTGARLPRFHRSRQPFNVFATFPPPFLPPFHSSRPPVYDFATFSQVMATFLRSEADVDLVVLSGDMVSGFVWWKQRHQHKGAVGWYETRCGTRLDKHIAPYSLRWQIRVYTKKTLSLFP